MVDLHPRSAGGMVAEDGLGDADVSAGELAVLHQVTDLACHRYSPTRRWSSLGGSARNRKTGWPEIRGRPWDPFCVPRIPTKLLCEAGMRIDPQVSLPMPAAAKLAAIAAPVPPLEPPGLRSNA